MNPEKPVLIFDGDCSFCRMWIDRWKARTGDSILYAPYQEVAKDFPEIPLENFQKSVQLVEPDGYVSSGAEAIYRSLSTVPAKRWMRTQYEHNPLFSAFSDFAYRVIASNRNLFFRITRSLWGNHVLPSTYSLSYWIYFRFLAVIFVIAFASLWIQIPGLIGSHGILPVRDLMPLAKATYGISIWNFPTLCWISDSDWFLQCLCAGGVVFSVLLFAGIFPSLASFLLWALYLSLLVVGQDFLSFQWDVLLLEAGFLTIFIAPGGSFSWKKSHDSPSSGFSFLLRWLLFRLMFSSGATKLLSGDLTWRNLTAMQYHYETQPLPTRIGWYAHHLPGWFQMSTTFVVLFLELIVPFLIFLPRRPRLFGFCALVIFQCLIILSGNYAFFNLLTMALCMPLIADRDWPQFIRKKFLPLHSATKSGKPARWLAKPLFLILLVLSVLQMTITLDGGRWLPRIAFHILQSVEEFRTVNRYGLFSVMTTARPEIILEGSNDDVIWEAYTFRYKPGDLSKPPVWVAPHQPRLDWQMWFAALGTYQSNRWFILLCQRLLEGSPEVMSLFASNPFPAHPPKYIRSRVYHYHFTTWKEKSQTADWWKRDDPKEYSPVFSLRAQNQ